MVVGCWEGSLFDSSTEAGFFTGVVTPFELGLALRGEGWRVRGGEWRGDLEELPASETHTDDTTPSLVNPNSEETTTSTANTHMEINSDSESESEPPEYDFRTGRYITSSRPMRSSKPKPTNNSDNSNTNANSTSLMKRSKNTDLATVNGVLSPGAEFLRSQRTWTGLGSDFERAEDGEVGGVIEEGRSGVARGYVVGEGERH